MEQLRTYLISLILTSVICSALPELLREGSTKKLVKTICGLVLSAAVLSPLGNFRLELPQELPHFQQEAAIAASSGEALAQNAFASVICTEAEAYILDKGAQWGADIRVELELSREPPYAPVAATFSGDISPDGKAALQELLETQFSIPKEAQTWIP